MTIHPEPMPPFVRTLPLALVLHACMLLTACSARTPENSADVVTSDLLEPSIDALRFSEDTLLLFDSTRQRTIPVALYKDTINARGLILFSHGYGANEPGTYLRYAYLAKALAADGQIVVSIQHELPEDPLLAMTGKLQETRRPNWERGAANIAFVHAEILRMHPEWSALPLSLVGHSNGGDMSLLFAEQYPALLRDVITLDNLRMPFPRAATPRISSLRASDTQADPGVLPTAGEQAEFGIEVIQLQATTHVDMDQRGTEMQQAEIIRRVVELLSRP
ncbi:MAG: alpha/beta hydrolase [Flavobacteriales bacterium]|nr:alpha/beta hydrolase [Flavobacteriales bacterium]